MKGYLRTETLLLIKWPLFKNYESTHPICASYSLLFIHIAVLSALGVRNNLVFILCEKILMHLLSFGMKNVKPILLA